MFGHYLTVLHLEDKLLATRAAIFPRLHSTLIILIVRCWSSVTSRLTCRRRTHHATLLYLSPVQSIHLPPNFAQDSKRAQTKSKSTRCVKLSYRQSMETLKFVLLSRDVVSVWSNTIYNVLPANTDDADHPIRLALA